MTRTRPVCIRCNKEIAPGHMFVAEGDPVHVMGCPANDEVRITDPKTGGQKGQKPERYSLLPWEAMAFVARVYAFGAQKYSDHNWRKGYRWSLSFDALWRHVAAAQRGDWVDEESGQPHLAHAVFHCLTLIVFMLLGLGTDDRACAPVRHADLDAQDVRDLR